MPAAMAMPSLVHTPRVPNEAAMRSTSSGFATWCNPIVHRRLQGGQPLEPDLVKARAAIRWWQHFVRR
jgi:hypothetical protein